MAKKAVISDLSPQSRYIFRYQFQQKGQSSDWSSATTVTTTREPLYAENLHMAIRRQSLSDLEEVLKSGEVSPDVQNEDGFTALMVAAKKSFLEAIEMLIQYGADVNYRNTAGKTALMTACSLGQLDSVKTLRKHQADYYLYDNGGCTAVHWAVDSKNEKLIDWIADDGADLNIKDRGQGGWTPLIRCALGIGSRNVLLSLLMKGAEANITDKTGNTALHHAVMKKSYNMVEILLKKHADPLLPNKEGNTAWKIAYNLTDDRQGIMALVQASVDKINEKRKTAAFQDARASAMQITSSLKQATETQSVAFPVK